jgi:hypothetical protein
MYLKHISEFDNLALLMMEEGTKPEELKQRIDELFKEIQNG